MIRRMRGFCDSVNLCLKWKLSRTHSLAPTFQHGILTPPFHLSAGFSYTLLTKHILTTTTSVKLALHLWNHMKNTSVPTFCLGITLNSECTGLPPALFQKISRLLSAAFLLLDAQVPYLTCRRGGIVKKWRSQDQGHLWGPVLTRTPLSLNLSEYMQVCICVCVHFPSWQSLSFSTYKSSKGGQS